METIDAYRLKKFYADNQLKVHTALLVAVLLGMFAFSGIQQEFNEREVMSNASNFDCTLEYGRTVCMSGKLRTPFFNPNERKITYVQLSVPVYSGTNVYRVDEPLPSNETGTLTTAECGNKKPGDLKVKWCCGGTCFRAPMVNPSDDLSLEGKR